MGGYFEVGGVVEVGLVGGVGEDGVVDVVLEGGFDEGDDGGLDFVEDGDVGVFVVVLEFDVVLFEVGEFVGGYFEVVFSVFEVVVEVVVF